MKTMWDKRYNTKDFIYGKEPNNFFADQLDRLNAGLILLPAEGEGRNAVYAASKGWKVHSFDSSTIARDKALDLAAERNVNILYALTNVQDFDPGEFKYDAIGLIYTHFPFEIRKNFFELIQTCLAPGGRIIFEGFDKKQINLTTGGPKDLSMLFSTEELKENFKNLNIEYLSAETVELDEGDGHRGTGEVVRMIATLLSP